VTKRTFKRPSRSTYIQRFDVAKGSFIDRPYRDHLRRFDVAKRSIISSWHSSRDLTLDVLMWVNEPLNLRSRRIYLQRFDVAERSFINAMQRQIYPQRFLLTERYDSIEI
jgi:hypothetical protein